MDPLIKDGSCVAVMPAYTLSTKAPYPAAIEDCYLALTWMKQHAEELGINENQLFAGGGLTAALCLYARNKGEINIAFQMPLYPMLDDRMTELSRNNDAPVWNSASNTAAWVSGWKVNTVRISLAVCLLATAVVVIMKLFGIGPYAGINEALLGLHGVKLAVALAVNFVLGMLMNLGFGLYAPCMGMLLALGMDVGAIFPIMMGSTAIQMPFSSTIFIKEGKYDPKAAVMLGIFGIIGVFLAYFFVKSMDVTYLLYIVIFVMIYTTVRYLIEGIRGVKAERKARR